jgi:diguanylate cyclase
MNSQPSVRRPRASVNKPATQESLSDNTVRAYHERVSALAERIRGTNDVSAIIDMLDQALTETRRLRSREEELRAAQRKVAEAERSIESMKSELEQVKALLHQDPLTATLNRRGVDEAFRQEASRCDRHGTRLALALIDLDDFKALNDTHGHPVGDRALVHVASLVRRTLRPSDRIGRLGGEEFVLLLPDTGAEDAGAVMARVRRELAATPLQEEASEIRITFSCGIAARCPSEPFETLLARADSALYEAKRRGKNRCMQARD